MLVVIFDRIKSLAWLAIFLVFVEATLVVACLEHSSMPLKGQGQQGGAQPLQRGEGLWQAPGISGVPRDEAGLLIRYGRELIEHTAWYLGPQGTVAQVSNGMNCQNCHLNAGTKPFAANYSAVASTYPKYRERSGIIEDVEKRVNDCFERSLNGTPLPREGREMKAIIAYLKWLGQDVPKMTTPEGAGLMKLPMLARSADTWRGKRNYLVFCSRCHRDDGRGTKADNGKEWKYPPLWGSHSYNTGAGLYRISTFARFIKANMPYGITYKEPVLSDEDAWDIAAFVNSMPRPHKDFSRDWPDLASKPFDHPFGPYTDNFSKDIHKYGPFGQILNAKKK